MKVSSYDVGAVLGWLSLVGSIGAAAWLEVRDRRLKREAARRRYPLARHTLNRRRP